MEMELPEPEVEEISNEQPKEETTEPNSETVEEPSVEAEDSTEQEEVQQEETEKPVKEPSAKEKAATKIVKKIDDKARYDDAAQIKTLIVMQILGDTKSFFDTQSIIQDNNINEYLDKSLEDQFGFLFQSAQNQTMEDLINGQY